MLGVVKIILIVIFVNVSLILIALTMSQSKDDAGVSSAVTGGAGNFYEKNKGKTKEGKQKRWTIILGIIFVLLVIALSIVYAM